VNISEVNDWLLSEDKQPLIMGILKLRMKNEQLNLCGQYVGVKLFK